jgi:ABC-type bacteriocin/lantibiotic exporter with double-glycine peptidase domain
MSKEQIFRTWKDEENRSPLLLLWLGARQVLDSQMSLGTMLAMNTIAIAFLTPLASLVSNGRNWQLVSAHMERRADVWEAEPEQVQELATPMPDAETPSGRIQLQGVNYRYDAQVPRVLRDISLDKASGQKVALVGRTGSGKSTLGPLLLGLYSPSGGQIPNELIAEQSVVFLSCYSSNFLKFHINRR